MRYADTASRKAADTIYAWLAELLPSAQAFACQTGYYRYDALDLFSADVKQLLAAGGRFDLVIGANEDRLSGPDLLATLELLGTYIPGNASFTLVGANNGLFHPKTYYIELGDGTRRAAVGSANFTNNGIGHNIEACLLLDDRTDDAATLDAIRDAILAWRELASTGSSTARRVTPEYIRELEAERVVEPIVARPPRPSGGGPNKTGKSSFPALKRIQGVPRRRARPVGVKATPGIKLGSAPLPFPVNAVGIVKRLSAKTDVKGFTGGAGTPYIALPPNENDLASRLPMKPYGKRGEPRLDVFVEARLDQAIQNVVTSGKDAANITYVGMGTTRGSNVDLRFNTQHGVIDGLRYVASQHGLALPRGGDVVAIEFAEGGRLLLLTFATAEPLRQTLSNLLHPGRSWGWLPAGTVPEW